MVDKVSITVNNKHCIISNDMKVSDLHKICDLKHPDYQIQRYMTVYDGETNKCCKIWLPVKYKSMKLSDGQIYRLTKEHILFAKFQ